MTSSTEPSFAQSKARGPLMDAIFDSGYFWQTATDERGVIQIFNAFEQMDMNTFARAAHSLKGAATNLGASSMETHCQRLESLVRDQQPQAVPELLR